MLKSSKHEIEEISTMLDEFCLSLDLDLSEDVKEFRPFVERGIEYYEIDLKDSRSYILLKSEEDAISLATIRAEDSFLDNPQLFNQDWIFSLYIEKLDNKSFSEYVAEEAVRADGFLSFLSSYSDDCITTPEGYIIIRTN